VSVCCQDSGSGPAHARPVESASIFPPTSSRPAFPAPFCPAHKQATITASERTAFQVRRRFFRRNRAKWNTCKSIELLNKLNKKEEQTRRAQTASGLTASRLALLQPGAAALRGADGGGAAPRPLEQRVLGAGGADLVLDGGHPCDWLQLRLWTILRVDLRSFRSRYCTET
jgi:hypothetical protein